MTVCIACREEAELEYLRVAQDLEMLGVNYFDITVMLIKDTYIHIQVEKGCNFDPCLLFCC